MGTPNYQAPEMLRTHREEAPGYTMAADWWSYGVLVYEVSEDRCPGPAACWCADADRGKDNRIGHEILTLIFSFNNV